MKKKKEDNLMLYVGLAVILLMALAVGYFGGVADTKSKYDREKYCVPKGYAGNYYSLEDKVSITILDLQDPYQSQISSQLDGFFKQLSTQKLQGGGS